MKFILIIPLFLFISCKKHKERKERRERVSKLYVTINNYSSFDFTAIKIDASSQLNLSKNVILVDPITKGGTSTIDCDFSSLKEGGADWIINLRWTKNGIKDSILGFASYASELGGAYGIGPKERIISIYDDTLTDGYVWWKY